MLHHFNLINNNYTLGLYNLQLDRSLPLLEILMIKTMKASSLVGYEKLNIRLN